MLTREQNEFLTRTGPGTPMGELFRRYWIPALLSCEIDGPPVRVRLLGEDLIAFRDSNGRGSAYSTRSARPGGRRCSTRRRNLRQAKTQFASESGSSGRASNS